MDTYLTEEEIDELGFEEAKTFIDKQKALMESVKKGNTERPEPGAKLEEIRKEATDKVLAMKNKATSVYYRNNNSINTIEEG